jgi:hypothetical protein
MKHCSFLKFVPYSIYIISFMNYFEVKKKPTFDIYKIRAGSKCIQLDWLHHCVGKVHDCIRTEGYSDNCARDWSSFLF